MSKNILVLTGSPRKGGNTDTLAEAFAKGAREKGHDVTIFNATKMTGGCRACDTCWSKGRACTFDDDFTPLSTLFEKADALVLATPLYWFGFSAQIKAALDRLYAYMSPNALRRLKIKEVALLTCAGEPAGYPNLFDGLIQTFEIMLHSQNWKNAGVVAVPDAMAKGDILNTDGPAQAEKLGRSF